MKLLFATYSRVKNAHTTVWRDIIDLLVKKYNWKLIDISIFEKNLNVKKKILKNYH